REGNLTLIRFYGRANDGSDEPELYDLSSDPSERLNLVNEKPEITARLRRLLDEFLLDTQAVIPRFNPDFDKARIKSEMALPNKAPQPEDLPGGWKNRAGTAIVREGILTVQSKGTNSFLGLSAGLPAGSARLTFRIRAPQAGEGKVTLLSSPSAKETLSVTYNVSGEAEWQTVTVELPVEVKTGILRLYLPSGSVAVDFDEIVLDPPQGQPRRWTFSP
ncbi:MAG: hypothetical protein ACK48K_06115, partial [Planctomycetota bacterium]